MYQRGEVVAVPYPFTALTALKTCPAVVISTNAYNATHLDVILAPLTTRTSTVRTYDYALTDWAAAGLRYPSVIRGRLMTLARTLIVRRVGRLSTADLETYDARLLSSISTENAIAAYLVKMVDLTALSQPLLQTVAEKAITAVIGLSATAGSSVDVGRLCSLLPR